MQTATKVIKDGFYQLADHVEFIFRIRTHGTDEKKRPGQQVIALANKPGSRTFINFGVIQDGKIAKQFMRWEQEGRDPIREAADLLLSGDMDEAGRVYARSFGRCYVCNRKLTDKHSLVTGIGPDCAGTKKHVELGLFDIEPFSN
jgi:hypothetical protein